jgi:hypothetical protein
MQIDEWDAEAAHWRQLENFRRRSEAAAAELMRGADRAK